MRRTRVPSASASASVFVSQAGMTLSSRGLGLQCRSAHALIPASLCLFGALLCAPDLQAQEGAGVPALLPPELTPPASSSSAPSSSSSSSSPGSLDVRLRVTPPPVQRPPAASLRSPLPGGLGNPPIVETLPPLEGPLELNAPQGAGGSVTVSPAPSSGRTAAETPVYESIPVPVPRNRTEISAPAIAPMPGALSPSRSSGFSASASGVGRNPYAAPGASASNRGTVSPGRTGAPSTRFRASDPNGSASASASTNVPQRPRFRLFGGLFQPREQPAPRNGRGLNSSPSPTPNPSARDLASDKTSASRQPQPTSAVLSQSTPRTAITEKDIQIRKILEKRIEESAGNRLKSLNVQVSDGMIKIVVRVQWFGQRAGVQKAIERLPAVPGYRVTLDVQ